MKLLFPILLLLCSLATAPALTTAERRMVEELRVALTSAQTALTSAQAANTTGLTALSAATEDVTATRLSLDLAKAEQRAIISERDDATVRAAKNAAQAEGLRLKLTETEEAYNRLRLWLSGLAVALVIAFGWQLFSALGPYGWGIGATIAVGIGLLVFTIT